MKDHSTPRHPGPFRITGIGGEAAAVILAVGFLVMGLVSVPIAKFFLLGAALVGIGIAILFRSLRKKPLFPKRFFSNGK